MALLSGISGSATTDPTSNSGQSSVKLQEDLNRFLNLLVTQLKHQDPLDPLDANEFTSQLVQFASVEQQIYQNANIEKLISIQQQSQISTLVSYIGTQVEAAGQNLPLQDGHAQFSYTLNENVPKATINILDSKGKSVYSADGDASSGKHIVEWDGTDKSGQTVADGAYTVVVSALKPDGTLASIQHTVYGKVTGAGADGGVVTLFMGDNVKIGLDKVLSVNQAPETATTE